LLSSASGCCWYWAYERLACSSMVVTADGSNPTRSNSSRSSGVKAVSRFKMGSLSSAEPLTQVSGAGFPQTGWVGCGNFSA
jgi:hypothetical protein